MISSKKEGLEKNVEYRVRYSVNMKCAKHHHLYNVTTNLQVSIQILYLEDKYHTVKILQ